jgi:EAL domain-containing protein (putative c-di-GMP-specific phosphodiesterase class I)
MIISASIGVATAHPNDDISPEDLIRNANIAMYGAKDKGRANTCLYDEAMNAQAMERLQTQTELRHALEQGEIVLHYQPIVDLTSGQIVGFEALARWHHPKRGLLFAGSFVPIAEESGLIVVFDWHMLQTACQQTAAFLAHVGDHISLVVHVNISGHTFLHSGLVEQVAEVLRQSGLPAHRLVLEITETVAMNQARSTIHTLHQLRALGVMVALDDFGIGYSSLRYLQQFPVQTIKIDASFVRTMEHNSGSAAIVETIISLAETLGMQVVAEGIENDVQYARLQHLNCCFGQGKCLSWAVPADDAFAMLSGQSSLRGAGCWSSDGTS